ATGGGRGGFFEPEGKVAAPPSVRKGRLIVESHRDAAALRLKVVHPPPADGDGAAADILEAGDHAQRRRFAATRWAYQHDKLAIFYRKIDVLDRDHVAVNLVHIGEHDVGH